jgi:hypothetical protein
MVKNRILKEKSGSEIRGITGEQRRFCNEPFTKYF